MKENRKRAADILVAALVEHNIEHCFSVVGGGAMHLNNAFAINNHINMIYNHHEQACTMAAEGYARLTGKLAAVCVTSGPGGTNAINGVQGAYVDSIPMIVISGHPRYSTTVEATGLDLRSRGVQENDIIAMVKNVTKYAKCIYNPLEIKYEIEKAINIALDGRRGPVWLDIPLDVQGTLVELDMLKEYTKVTEKKQLDEDRITQLLNEIESATRPCILTGSGIRTGDAWENYREFIKFIKIPIIGGALQADINCSNDHLYFGLSGSSGPRCGNFILQNADFILVLGNSLSYKQTGFNQEEFAKNAKIVMVDAHEDEGKKPGLHVDDIIVSDLKNFFNACNLRKYKIEASDKWLNYCKMVRESFPKYEMLEANRKEIRDDEPIAALDFWNRFMKKSREDEIIALGNSSCILGVLTEGIEDVKQRVVVNYNCGSMGHDLPNAIGSAVASNKIITLVTGDGSIMMNLQELQTIYQYKLPVRVVVFTNNGYNAIRNTCTNFFNGVYMGCDKDSGVSFPDFGEVAKTFNFPYKCCANTGDLEESIEWLLSQKSYCMLEICERLIEIPNLKTESIMLEDGAFVTAPIHDLSPRLDKSILEKYMIVKEKI